MSRKHDTVLKSFVETLRKGIKGYRDLPSSQQWWIAKLVWEEGMQNREHKLHEGYMTISFSELYRAFGRGRGGFEAMNNALGIFEVTPNWYKDDGLTKGYKVATHVKALKKKYLRPFSRAIERRMYLDGGGEMRTLQSLPRPIAPKHDDDPLGITASAWKNAKILNKVPVNLDALRLLYGVFSQMEGQSDLFAGMLSPKEKADMCEWIGQLFRLAQTDVAGRGYIAHRYAESKTGRLYAKGVSLQTTPKEIRNVILQGLYDYDIENCHFEIFSQLAEQYGYKPQAIHHYLANKKQVREGIAKRINATKEQTKMALLALMYGAKKSTRKKNAIPKKIGVEKAEALYQDHEFAALAEDVIQGRRIILDGWPKGRTTLTNALGKRIGLDEKPEVRMAHIIQGIEAKAIRAAIELYPHEVALLMHDGFVTTRPIDTELVQRTMHEATGFNLPFVGGEIVPPPDLNIATS